MTELPPKVLHNHRCICGNVYGCPALVPGECLTTDPVRKCSQCDEEWKEVMAGKRKFLAGPDVTKTWSVDEALRHADRLAMQSSYEGSKDVLSVIVLAAEVRRLSS